MQSRRERENCSPFLLFSARHTGAKGIRAAAITHADSAQPPATSSAIEQALSHVLAPGAAAVAGATDAVTPAVAPDFASRYEGEIASQARVREYRQLGLRHRASLTAEARGLQGGAAGGPAGTAQRAAGGGAGLPLRGRAAGAGGIGGGGARVGGARDGLGQTDGARATSHHQAIAESFAQHGDTRCWSCDILVTT